MAKDTKERILALTLRMAAFTVRDEKVVMTRKLLSIEQFRDKRARELATGHFLTGLTEMFARLFAGMMDKGLLRRDDPAMLALAYTARIEAFSRHFIRTYGA